MDRHSLFPSLFIVCALTLGGLWFANQDAKDTTPKRPSSKEVITKQKAIARPSITAAPKPKQPSEPAQGTCAPPDPAKKTQGQCGQPSEPQKKQTSIYQRHKINTDIQPNPTIEKMIQPFREKLRKKMSQIIGMVGDSFVRKRPESNLGNLVSETAMAFLKKKKYKVDVFITNLGGIRRDLAMGLVTMRDAFEILPFENQLVLLQVSGKKLREIFQGLVKRGGEPFAGARIIIDAKKKVLKQLFLGKQPVKQDKTYSLATTGYVAKTGWISNFVTRIKQPLNIQLTHYKLRDSFVWGLKHTSLIEKSKLGSRYHSK